MQKQITGGISLTTLHLLAMAFMLCDSLCLTFAQDSSLLQFAGRLAYPVFAFMVVEGYFYTTDLKDYAKRLLILAIVSEIPFNLLYSSTVIYPFQQNAVWALLLGLLLVHLNETVRKNSERWFFAVTILMSFVIAVAAGQALICDYCGTGVIMVLGFYLFRGRKLWCLAGQILALYYANVMLTGGQQSTFSVFGMPLTADIQIFTLLALVPIWFYKGKKDSGRYNIGNICCGFYPLHMFVLAMMFING